VKEKFEFRYDLLRHSAYCIVHEIVIEALRSSNQVRNIKRDQPKLDFDLKDFTIEEEETKSKN